jgi:hypothetical protein
MRLPRFLASLLPPALLLGGFFAVIAVVTWRFGGLTGAILGIVAGACLVFGILLAYWNVVDWSNLRTIRTSTPGAGALADDEIVAVEGVVKVDGPAMRAPFSGTACAAYTYVVSYSRPTARGRSERRVLAQGFHMVPTRIEGEGHSVRLGSFPAFEDDLRESASGRQWGTQATALFDTITERAPAASDRERTSRLIEVRQTEIDEVHQDYRMGTPGENVEPLAIEEEVLPVGQSVCVIGTYEGARQRLTGRRSRIGPNLIVYRGTAPEVLSRVGGDIPGYTKAVAVLTGIGVTIVGTSLLPASLTARLPVVGSSVAAPADTSPEPAVEMDPLSAYRAQVDAGVRREFAAGDRSRALSLAVDADAHDTVRWLIAQGVSPDTPMPERDGWAMTPLVEASRLGHVETVRALLEGGADANVSEAPNPATGQRRSALGEALREGHCAIAALLERAGARRPDGVTSAPCR